MSYVPLHAERVRPGGPLATPVLLAAALTTGSASAAYVQTREVRAVPSLAGLFAERAEAAEAAVMPKAAAPQAGQAAQSATMTTVSRGTLTTSRTATRAALTRALPSHSRYASIDPAHAPVVNPALLTVTGADSRATAKLRGQLADAVRAMQDTGRVYAAAAARAANESLAMTTEQSLLIAHRGVAPAGIDGLPWTDDSLVAARTDELTAADAQRAAIYTVLKLRSQVVASSRADAVAAKKRVDAAIAAGDLVRLPDGTTSQMPAIGTPIPGNGWTLGAPVRGWIAHALTTLYANGYPVQHDDAINLATIIYNESGGDPSVRNLYDSNAAAGMPSFGLMQTIGPTFTAFALPGHANAADPVHQIMAGARYAQQTYGSLGNVPGVRNLAAGGGYLPY